MGKLCFALLLSLLSVSALGCAEAAYTGGPIPFDPGADRPDEVDGERQGVFGSIVMFEVDPDDSSQHRYLPISGKGLAAFDTVPEGAVDADTVVAVGITDDEGWYALGLPPGNYALCLIEAGGDVLRAAECQEMTVTDLGFDRWDYCECDRGGWLLTAPAE
jgi:hypothetical protein